MIFFYTCNFFAKGEDYALFLVTVSSLCHLWWECKVTKPPEDVLALFCGDKPGLSI